jgi:hypothetical protein
MMINYSSTTASAPTYTETVIPMWVDYTASYGSCSLINDYAISDAVTNYKILCTYDTDQGMDTIKFPPITLRSYDTVNNYIYYPKVITKNDLLRLKRYELKSQLVIQVTSRNDVSRYPGEIEPERKALETLREIISEAEFRKYLRYGFVLVKGQSGRTYQVFKNRSHCKVWLNGKVVEEVCVRIKNKEIPLTDNVVAFKTMIETSEEEFKKLGNVYKMVG